MSDSLFFLPHGENQMSKQRKVYYRLVTRDGQAYADTDADFVMCSSDEEIMSLV